MCHGPNHAMGSEQSHAEQRQCNSPSARQTWVWCEVTCCEVYVPSLRHGAKPDRPAWLVIGTLFETLVGTY